jgi:hypothetical protein
MKLAKKCKSIQSRAAAKKASRRSDRQRLEQGLSPADLQRENSIFPPGYFENHRILNFASAVGR